MGRTKNHIILKNYQIPQNKEKENIINLTMIIFNLKSFLLVLIYLVQDLNMKVIKKQCILIIKRKKYHKKN